jgi:hypothetical protein
MASRASAEGMICTKKQRLFVYFRYSAV